MVRAIAARFSASFVGLSPATIALILAVGLVLGVFPVYGCPTIFCAVAAVILRLNFPAIQLINTLASPLQIVLLVPLNRLGARVMTGYAAFALPASWSIAGAARDAVIGWLCLCVPLGIAFYFILALALRRSVNLVSGVPGNS